MDVRRTFDILDLYRDKIIKNDILNAKENGKWINYSTDDYIRISNNFSYGLIELGLNPGDKVALVANNRPEWNFVDMGVSQAGVINVPIYPTISFDEYRYILNHCEARIVIVSDKSLYEKIAPIVSEIKLASIYTINQVEGARNWMEIVQLGEANKKKHEKTLEERKAGISPADLTTLIYTSGTTGFPKGVMLSHNNLVSNFKAIKVLHNFNENNRILSFLPLCHVFERTVNYHYQYMGMSIYYAENMGTIGDNLKEVKPSMFVAVPRVIESVYDKILSKGKDLPKIKKSIFFWALNLATKYSYNNGNSWFYKQRLKLADKLVFCKWREALGGNAELVVVGGAALQPRLSRVFGAAGIPLLEGYGLTETAPVVSCNNVVTGEIRVGTVGPVLPGVQVKIAEDGEIMVFGPNIMMGYFNEPEMTREVINEDGWLHTGDIGVLEEGKYLKITDRKKEMFKLSNGKYIAPQVIENKFKECYLIEQIMVIGEQQKFASALISPNFMHLHYWASYHHISFRDNQELVSLPQVNDKFQKEVNSINKTLGQHEQIKRFRLVCDEWTPATGELSPTLKLKRNVLYEEYKDLVDEIFRLNGD